MITSTLGRMASADKLSVQQLKQAVQNGTVPAYIGIPLLQEKLKQSQQAQASQAGQAPPQPPIADQIMQQAEGVPALQSNLPAQYAHGGVIHLASGGYDPMAMARAFTHDEEDPEDIDFLNALGADQMPETQEPEEELETQGIQSDSSGISDLAPVSTLAYAAPFSTTRQADQVTVKQEGEPAQTVRKETARVERPAAARDLERIALLEGEKYKLDPSLIKHVMFKETGGLKDRAGAVSSAGAMGVMQLMPATARELGVKDPFDPVQNIEGGVKYLAKMQRKYDDPKLAAIAYNWGPGRTDRWLAQGGDFAKLPKETQGYIKGMAKGGMTDDDTDGLTVNLSGDDYSDMPDVVSQADFSDALSIPDYTTEGSDFKNILKQKVEVGKQYKPGIGEITGYEIVPSTKGHDRAKSQNVGKTPPKNLPEPKPVAKPAPAPVKEDVLAGPRSIGDVDAALQYLSEQENAPAKPAEKAKPEDTGYSELKDYYSKGIAGLEEQKKINAYMALLSAGLGIAGGTSPHAMTNIGQGAQAGVQAYMAGNKDVAAQQAAIMQGRLGLEKYQSLRDIQKGQAENLQEYRKTEGERKTEAAKMRNLAATTATQTADMGRAEKLMAQQEKTFEARAVAQVVAKFKGNIMLQTPEGQAHYQSELDAAKNQARLEMMQDPLYRKLHTKVTGVDPIEFLPKTPAAQTSKPAVQNW
jgi:hypothetical protein